MNAMDQPASRTAMIIFADVHGIGGPVLGVWFVVGYLSGRAGTADEPGHAMDLNPSLRCQRT
jgi:hypothetical protein